MQFGEASMFVSKAKIKVFLKFFRVERPQRDQWSEKKIQKTLILAFLRQTAVVQCPAKILAHCVKCTRNLSDKKVGLTPCLMVLFACSAASDTIFKAAVVSSKSELS